MRHLGHGWQIGHHHSICSTLGGLLTILVKLLTFFFFDSIEHIEGDQIVTTYVRVWPHGLPTCSFAEYHSADPITKIKVFSPASTRLEVSVLSF